MAVDWDWIGEKLEGEGVHKTGYVPPTHLPSKRGSGFTVGSLDVGQHSREDIRTMLQGYANVQAGGGKGSNITGSIRSDLLKKLEPYTKDKDSDKEYGRIGSIWKEYGSQAGYDMMAKTEKFQSEDIKYIMAAKRNQFGDQLKERKGWDQLSDEQQTVITSFGWQWGTGFQDEGTPNERNRFEELWATRGNKSEMGTYLRKSGRESGYKGRRDLEADRVDPLPLSIKEVMDENNKIGQTR